MFIHSMNQPLFINGVVPSYPPNKYVDSETKAKKAPSGTCGPSSRPKQNEGCTVPCDNQWEGKRGGGVDGNYKVV